MAKILVIGSVNVDFIGIGNEILKLHDSNIGHFDMHVGGVGKNIAENLYRLQSDVSFLTFIGNDYLADFVCNYLNRLGIDYQKSIHMNQHSGTYLAIHEPDGSLTIGINDLQSLEAIEPAIVASQSDYIDEFDTIVMEANLPIPVLDELFSRYHNKTIIVDGVSQTKVIRFKKYLSQINILKVNRSELTTLLGHQVDDVITGVKEIIGNGLKQVVVTEGKGPITFNIDNAIFQTSVITPKHYVSSVGCGDALLSGVIYGITTGVSMFQAIEYGKQIAALTMEVKSPCYQLLTNALLNH